LRLVLQNHLQLEHAQVNDVFVQEQLSLPLYIFVRAKAALLTTLLKLAH
jgi:hypothetical protein